MAFFDKLVNAKKDEINEEKSEEETFENKDEVIAVISAAVGAYLGTNEFKVKLIKRVNPYSIWARAEREELIRLNI